MTTATRTAWWPRWALALLAAVLAVAVGLFTAGPASALTVSAAETRVGASASTAGVLVGSSANITAGQRLGNDAPQAQIVVATGVAANTVDDVAGAAAPGPNFIVRPNGETVIVPQGASGPVPTRGDGFQFTGGSGGNGLHPSVSDVRIMDPVLEGKYTYPNGYASYLNSGGQTVNPFTGQTVGKSSPWWHWAFE